MTTCSSAIEELAIFEIEAPDSMVGYTLEELEIRKRYELNLITIKRLETDDRTLKKTERYRPIGILTGKTKVEKGDRFLLVGSKQNCDKLLETN